MSLYVIFFWDCVHVATFWKKLCIFVRVSILDHFSLVVLFKDVLFAFYNSRKNVQDEYLFLFFKYIYLFY